MILDEDKCVYVVKEIEPPHKLCPFTKYELTMV
jgi:hypothetical protein